jgi:glyoxylate reductase
MATAICTFISHLLLELPESYIMRGAMPPHRLVLTRRLPVDPAEIVGAGVEVRVLCEDRPPTSAELRAGAEGAAALVTLVSDTIDADLMDALPGLRIVANVAVGFNNIDVRAATARGIWVTNTPDVLTDATADLTLALLLAVARRIGEGERFLRAGNFQGWSPTLLLGRELRGATLGIFGFGRIGQAVARRALAFGMRILFTTRGPVPAPVIESLGARPVGKNELLASSDVLSIHCRMTEETRRAFGARELAAMKRGAILLNTARGPVVDEAALVDALARGHLGGAGLDVFEEEPLVHAGLLGREDVVLLPHLGSATRETRRKMAQMALGDACRVLRGETPLNPVNEPAL